MPNKPYVKPGTPPQTEDDAKPGIGLWLAEGLVSLPRLLRIGLTLLLTLGVTLATFPILTQLFRLLAQVTGNPNLIVGYLFTRSTVTLYALVSVSLLIGCAFYVVGYLILVGTRGETPPVLMRVVWYFVIGVVAVVICALWLTSGILAGASTV